MKRVIFIIILALIAIPTFAGTTEGYYDIVGAGVGTQGTTLVKVTVESKKVSPKAYIIDELKSAAVRGILFKGCTQPATHKTEKPLISSLQVENQNSDYFKMFFSEGGAYSNYADIVSDQFSVVKVRRKLYRVSGVVSVNRDLLRSALEDANIIRGLNSGF